MNNKNTIFCKKNLAAFFLVTVLISITKSSASGNIPTGNSIEQASDSLNPKILDSEWNTLINQQGVSIFYAEVKNNPCVGYSLKIVNQSNAQKTINFGVPGNLPDECKALYENFGSFKSRKIILPAYGSMKGSQSLPSLLLPKIDNSSLEMLMQNLTIQ